MSCLVCKITKQFSDFYLPYKVKGRSNLKIQKTCKICHKVKVVERMQSFKQQCVSYKGGECSKCGYNKCLAALDFHHIDPMHKDFGIAKVKKRSFDGKIKAELDKCILVCANCHREIHNNMHP